MNRLYYILVLIVGLGFNLFAQTSNSSQDIAKEYIAQFTKAKTLISKHNFKKAKETLTDLLSKNDIDIVGCANKSEISNKLGVCYYFLNDYLNAFIIWKEQTLPLRKSCDLVNPKRTAQTYYNIGYTFGQFRDLINSNKYLDSCILVLKNNNQLNSQKGIRVFMDLYSNSSKAGDYIQAESYLFKALTIVNNLDLLETELSGNLHSKIGYNFIHRKEYKKAKNYLNIGRRILKKNNSILLAVTYRYFAILNYEEENYKNAIKWINKAYSIYKEKNFKNTKSFSELYEIHGLTLSLGGKPKKALELYKKTLQIKIKLHLPTSNIYENIAGAYGRLNMLDSALYYIDLSIVKAHSIKNLNIPDDYKYLIKTDFSKKTMIRKLQMRAKYLNRKYFKNKNIQFLILSEKNFSMADSLVIELRKEILNKNSKIILSIDLDTIYKYAIDNSYTLWKETKDNKYKERTYYYSAQNKSAVFSETKEELNRVWNLLSPNIRKRYLDINNRLKENLYKKQYAVLKNDSISYRNLNNKYLTLSTQKEKLLKNIKINTPEFFQKSNRMIQYNNIEFLQSKLENNNAIIEYYIDSKTLYTFAISKNNFFLNKTNTELNLDSLFLNFYDELWLFKNLEGVAKTSKKVYPILFPNSLKAFLEKENAERLIIIRDKSMNKITFAPILTGSDYRNDFLINKYSFSYAFNNKYIWDNTNTKKDKKYTFGGFATTYDQATLKELNKDTIFWERSRPPNLLELKQSQLEVSNIAKLFDSQIWIGNDCTLENFQNHAGDYEILHLSLHSLLAENNNEQNALIFQKQNNNDFILKSEDLLNLNLNNYLTVLSSCSTSDGAVIPTEGIKSIARSFFLSGSPAIIATQWHAFEGQTSEIYELFYKNLHKGYPKDIALQMAQQKFIHNVTPEYLAPSNWGNFTLIGDPTKMPASYSYYSLIIGTFISLIVVIALLLFKHHNKQLTNVMKSKFY